MPAVRCDGALDEELRRERRDKHPLDDGQCTLDAGADVEDHRPSAVASATSARKPITPSLKRRARFVKQCGTFLTTAAHRMLSTALTAQTPPRGYHRSVNGCRRQHDGHTNSPSASFQYCGTGGRLERQIAYSKRRDVDAVQDGGRAPDIT